jgi:hypothetical protein
VAASRLLVFFRKAKVPTVEINATNTIEITNDFDSRYTKMNEPRMIADNLDK